MNRLLFRSLPLLGRRVQPKDKLAERAVRRENLLKEHGIKKYNKRFRSWAQHRVRQYTLGKPVSLQADPKSMDWDYLTSCFQKAAALRKHDLELWRGLSNRAMFLLTKPGICSPLRVEQVGYIFWGIGKTRYYHSKLLNLDIIIIF